MKHRVSFFFCTALLLLPVTITAGDGLPVLDLPTIADRSVWDAFADETTARWIGNARQEEAREYPPYDEDLFLEYSRTGERGAFDRRHGGVIARYESMVLAELVENEGRFLPAIVAATDEILAEPTWVLSAHDSSLDSFYGRAPSVDLASSRRGMVLALASVLLEPVLPPEVVEQMRAAVETRVLAPYRDAVVSGDIPIGLWWINTTNNWNSVCHLGVVTAALAIESDPVRQSQVVDGMNTHLPLFLDGFTDDGYCSEGLGYWNYGFGHFVMLSEFVRRASDGRDDWLESEKAVSAALFPFRLELAGNTYPIFADGVIGTRPSPVLLDYLARRIKAIGTVHTDRVGLGAASLQEILSYGLYDDSAPIAEPGFSPLDPKRGFFPEAGLLVFRPEGSAARMALALKAGHNGEHHNHNDVGSLVVAVDHTHLVIDPGAEVYTARTFSARRYESDILNSFGHPVPRIGGQLQSVGSEYHGSILSTEFSESEDRAVLDLAPAYAVEGLLALTRAVVFSRLESGSVTVTDTVELAQPESFETALTTYGKWQPKGPNRALLYEGAAALEISWTSTSADIVVSTQPIEGRMRHSSQPLRIAFTTTAPVTGASITLTMKPAGSPESYEVDMSGYSPRLDQAVRVQAEDAIDEKGGAIMILGKINADGLAFKNWDDLGHALSWKFPVARAGDYALRLRYCHAQPGVSRRELSWHGQVGRSTAVFPPTGGWSSFSDDWSTIYAGNAGMPIITHLEAGPQTLTMVNSNGESLNLDWIELVPAD